MGNILPLVPDINKEGKNGTSSPTVILEERSDEEPQGGAGGFWY
jgi:hypothetical protein